MSTSGIRGHFSKTKMRPFLLSLKGLSKSKQFFLFHRQVFHKELYFQIIAPLNIWVIVSGLGNQQLQKFVLLNKKGRDY